MKSQQRVPDYRPDELLTAQQAAKYLGISHSAWMERLYRTYQGMLVKDVDGNELRRAYRRGYRLKPVAGPLYGWVSNLFRASDVEKFGSLLKTRGGRISTILDKIKATREPAYRSSAKEPVAKMRPLPKPRVVPAPKPVPRHEAPKAPSLANTRPKAIEPASEASSPLVSILGLKPRPTREINLALFRKTADR